MEGFFLLFYFGACWLAVELLHGWVVLCHIAVIFHPCVPPYSLWKGVWWLISPWWLLSLSLALLPAGAILLRFAYTHLVVSPSAVVHYFVNFIFPLVTHASQREISLQQESFLCIPLCNIISIHIVSSSDLLALSDFKECWIRSRVTQVQIPS